jgi:thiamine pyrophosphokinase
MNISPDVWIGDFDSCKMSDDEFVKFSKGSKVVRLNPVKDSTDTECACDYAIEQGYKSIVIFGALGSRFDHTLANVFLLFKLEKDGVDVKIINEKNIIYLAKEENLIYQGDFENVSLIPVCKKIDGVTITGMYYDIVDADISRGSSLGVSNKLISDVGKITIKKGKALIILSKD